MQTTLENLCLEHRDTYIACAVRYRHAVDLEIDGKLDEAKKSTSKTNEILELWSSKEAGGEQGVQQAATSSATTPQRTEESILEARESLRRARSYLPDISAPESPGAA